MSTDDLRAGEQAGATAPPEALTVSRPKAVAAGLPGVAAAARHALGEMGVRRTVVTLREVNQKSGFDCPGCAWPESEDRSHAEFCENGAKAVAEEATTKRIGREFFAAHPLSELRGRDDFWLGKQGRLTEPLLKRRDSDHYEPLSWDAAFSRIAEALRGLTSPDEAVFYTSGRTSNEAAFAYQLFVRAFGTNNLPDCSNLCHESSGVALTETIGVGKGSVTLEDLHRADLIFVVGQNPATNHPRMLTTLERAKRNGARIIAVNPLPEAGLLRFKNPQRAGGLLGRGTSMADQFLQIRVNGDLALFKALNALLLEADDARGDVVDHAFVREHCEDFEAFAAAARQVNWDDVHAGTGLTRAEIEAVVPAVLAARRIIVCWAMGLTQHRNSVATIREIVNFLLLTGNIGRPGAGLCPVRGHSNVQGDRTMGINERPTDAFLDRLAAACAFEPPRAHGYDVVEAIRAMREGRVKVFMAMGGNFASAAPDSAATEAALERCELTVQVSTKLNRSHVVTGAEAIILPCLGRTERDVQASGEQIVTVEDSMGMVHGSRGVLAPASAELRSEVAIITELAERVLGPTNPVDWRAWRDDYRNIRAAIAAAIPGFEDFEVRLERDGGFLLPHQPRDARQFPTATGRARFTVNELEVLRVPPGRLLLQTVRSHDQYNTTIYGLDDRYRGVKGGRRVVFVHPADLAELGIADGAIVDLVSEHDGQERRAPRFRVVSFPTARGCAAAYFPETNVLVPLDSTAVGSGTPTSKSIVIRLEPAPPPAAEG